MIKGYKAFYENMENRYGMRFEENKTYYAQGPLRFGNDGNGFHFCRRLEDTLRYFPAMEEKIQIAKVTSLGEYEIFNDEYYGYYDLYVTRELKIDKILTREEIIKMYLDMDTDRVIRFVSGYRLTPEEIELFKLRYSDDKKIIKAILYYQEGFKHIYNEQVKVKIKK